MDKTKCITFDKAAQDALPQHIKDKMKQDREIARLSSALQKAHGRLKFLHKNSIINIDNSYWIKEIENVLDINKNHQD